MNALSTSMDVNPESVQDLPRFNPRSHLCHSSMLSLQGAERAAKDHQELSPEEQQELRRKINSRERRRMQDLNVAMDALREVMVPSTVSLYSHQTGTLPGRRLSKISTLVLARNCIVLLGSSLQEMRRLIGEVSMGVGVDANPVPKLLLAGCPLISGPSHFLLSPDSLLGAGASTSTAKCPLLSPGHVELPLNQGQWSSSGGPHCPCGMCTLPRFCHSSPGPRFYK